MDQPLDHLLAALKAALAAREELPLIRVLKQPGMFSSRAGAAGEAVQWALRDGLLEITRTESKAKSETEWARITPRGVQFLAQQESPKEVLQELVQLLALQSNGVPRWLTDLQAQMQGMQRRLQEFLDGFTAELQQLSFRVSAALQRCRSDALPTPPVPLNPWQLDLLEQLRLRDAAAAEPLPLHRLFAELQKVHAALTVPAFHEGLLHLRDRGSLGLVAWPHALSELHEPEFALLEEGRVHWAVQRRQPGSS